MCRSMLTVIYVRLPKNVKWIPIRSGSGFVKRDLNLPMMPLWDLIVNVVARASSPAVTVKLVREIWPTHSTV